jgi:SpoVK/Ycf46/Vps4 family AAA+-type ATPase
MIFSFPFPFHLFTALLRPGRFEVQVEVPPPKSVEQRVSILNVHTRNMHDAGRLLVSDPPAGTAAARYCEVRIFDADIPNSSTLSGLTRIMICV